VNAGENLAVDLLGRSFKRVCQEKADLEVALERIVNTLGSRCDLDADERAALDAGIALLQRLEKS